MTMRQTRRDSIVGGRSIARSGSVRSAVRLLPICSQRRPGREAGRKNSLNLLGNLEPEFLGLRDLADPGAFSRPSTIRPPTSAALSISAVLAENVHASQVEMPSGFQLMAVVRVDLLKAMLLGAGQVQRVTGSEEDRARNVEDSLAGRFQQLRSDTKPLPHAVLLIIFEVFQDRRHLPASHMALSDVPLEDRCKLQSGQLTRCEAVCAIGDFADSIRARLIEVALGDVRRVEVDHRSSRSSDWYTTESTEIFDRLRIAASRLGRGRPVIEASNG